MFEGDTYFFYAIRRFGIADGLWRWWKYHGSPIAWLDVFERAWTRWGLRDHREKYRWGARTVYAVNRDGDLGLVECPKCRKFQDIWFEEEEKRFRCSICDIGFTVYLEDGLQKIRDHRNGNVPTPATALRDDAGILHLGITRDAPWWWRRVEVYRDFNAKTGKDGHGHHPYKIEALQHATCGEMQRETPQR